MESSYIWNSPRRPLSVHLALDVQSRLTRETRGLLLGRLESSDGLTVVRIEDFAPIGSSHVDAVGVFRTQGGSQPLVLAEDDSVLFRLYFGARGRVFLLIQPDSHRAAFFLPQEGGGFGPGQPPEHEFSFPAPRTHDGPSAPAPQSGLRAIVTAAALLAGAVGGATMVYFKDRPASNQQKPAANDSASRRAVALTRPSPESPPTDSGTPLKAQPFRLNVLRQDQVLRVRWEPNAPTVRNATRGVMYISDGSQQTQLDLNTAELSSGLLSYWPETEDVQFRLELFLRDETKTFADAVAARPDFSKQPIPYRPASSTGSPRPSRHEEIRPSPFAPPRAANASGARGSSPDNATKLDGAPRSGAALKPDVVSKSDSSDSALKTDGVLKTGGAARLDGAPKTDAAPKPDVAPKPDGAPKPDIAPKPFVAAPPSAHEITVAAEPVGGPRWGRVVGRIPLVRRLRKHPQDFIPPQPIHRVMPVLNSRTAASSAFSDVELVDVKLHVTESGKVEYAELISSGMGRRRDANSATAFVEAAVGAARRWEFLPAHVGPENVPGDVVLHFRFNP